MLVEVGISAFFGFSNGLISRSFSMEDELLHHEQD